MPRTSRKQNALKRVDEFIVLGMKHGIRLKLFGLSTAAVDDFILHCCLIKNRLQNERHVQRGRYRKRKGKFDLLLDPEHDEALDEKEFLFHFRHRDLVMRF